MDALKKKRRLHKLNVGRAKDQLTTLCRFQMLDIETLSKLEAAIFNFLLVKKQFEDITEECLMAVDEKAEDYNNLESQFLKDLDEANMTLFQYEGKVKAFNKTLSTQQSRESLVPSNLLLDNSVTSNHSNSCQPRLNRIHVPKFDGDILKFMNFKSLFENLIHENNELSNVQKLYYLKEALIGDAQDIICDFELSERAYSEAWEYLNKRYDNRRTVVRTLFRNLRNLEPIKYDSSIRYLLDKVDVIIRGLKAHEETIDTTFSRYIAYCVSCLLDQQTLGNWEILYKSSKTCPTYNELHEFLQCRSFAVEDSMMHTNSRSNPQKVQNEKSAAKGEKNTLMVNSNSKSPCILCLQNHFLNQCKKFIEKTVNQRFQLAKANRLCLKCFNFAHCVGQCTRLTCHKCSGNHHTLLHQDPSLNSVSPHSTSSPSTTVTPTSDTSNTGTTLTTNTSSSSVKMFQSAVVYVNLNSCKVKARLLFDPCSEGELVSEKFVRNNKICTCKSTSIIGGITDTAIESNRSVQLSVSSRYNKFSISFNADVLPRIPCRVDRKKIELAKSIFPDVELADTDVNSDEVDILLGVKYVNSCLLGERRSVDKIYIEKSQFGWVASGAFTLECSTDTFSRSLVVNIESQLKKFWEIEEIALDCSTSSEHELCEKHFVENTRHLDEGRFEVSLPFKRSKNDVADVYYQALCSLKRSKNLPIEIQKLYSDFMREYREIGHMEFVPENERDTTPVYYMPHHCVVRPERVTNKLRVVFNASASNKTGCLLNEALMVGPSLQPELFDTLLRFCSFAVAFNADIAKMYCQVSIQKEDCDMQQILWRDNPKDHIDIYRLKTVTYGTAPASYIATKCLQQLADSICQSHPIAAKSIETEFYVDDLMSGAATVKEAIQQQRIIHQTLADASFPLLKYTLNSTELLNAIDNNLTDNMKTLEFNRNNSILILGLRWLPKNDSIGVKIDEDAFKTTKLTRRSILSLICRVFDPLGLLAPFTV